jgi:hypothetical protein
MTTTTITQVLLVDDIEAARDELIERGVDVGEVWHLEPGEGSVRGRDPERRSYFSRATFTDPEGNTWLLEERTERTPGWLEMLRAGSLAKFLFETATRRGEFEPVSPLHDWWDWYAAYMDAREHGSIQERAAEAAGRYMAEARRVVARTDTAALAHAGAA